MFSTHQILYIYNYKYHKFHNIMKVNNLLVHCFPLLLFYAGCCYWWLFLSYSSTIVCLNFFKQIIIRIEGTTFPIYFHELDMWRENVPVFGFCCYLLFLLMRMLVVRQFSSSAVHQPQSLSHRNHQRSET